MTTIEEYEIYKAVKREPQNVLNDKLSFQSNLIYDTAIRIIEQTSKQKIGPDKSDSEREGEGKR